MVFILKKMNRGELVGKVEIVDELPEGEVIVFVNDGFKKKVMSAMSQGHKVNAKWIRWADGRVVVNAECIATFDGDYLLSSVKSCCWKMELGDEVIEKVLEQVKRVGVPMYVTYSFDSLDNINFDERFQNSLCVFVAKTLETLYLDTLYALNKHTDFIVQKVENEVKKELAIDK